MIPFPFKILVSLLFLLTPGAHAGPVHVVEVANFNCEYCYRLEPMQEDLRREVESGGGSFRFAPISEFSLEALRDRVYYAGRSWNSEWEDFIRSALFRAGYVYGLPLEAPAELRQYLEEYENMAVTTVDRLIALAETEEVLETQKRGVRLAARSAINQLPAYIFVRDNRIVKVLSRDTHPELPRLRNEVFATLKALRTDAVSSKAAP